MLAHALVRTVKWFGATSYGRILNGFATMANALFEVGNKTTGTRILVTQLFAFVEATFEHAVA